MNLELEVNGFKYNITYSESEIKKIFIPLLNKLISIRRQRNNRIIVFLAAPPATGKSTLALFLEQLSKKLTDFFYVQALSLDGFHYTNIYLKNHRATIDSKEYTLHDIKGMPETFDFESLYKSINNLKNKNLKWPIYDRTLHDPISDAIEVTSDIVIIEGNWLLLAENKWDKLKELCDYSIFIDADGDILKDRLIKRKLKGGSTYNQALEFYERTDSKNVNRVMEHRLSSDITLKLLESGEYSLKTEL